MRFNDWWEQRLPTIRREVPHELLEFVYGQCELAWEAAQEQEQGDSELFKQFWAMYPRRVGKPAAKKKFNRLKKSEQQAILAHLPVRQWPQDKQFIPHPSTFLNQRRWEDEEDDAPDTAALGDVF